MLSRVSRRILLRLRVYFLPRDFDLDKGEKYFRNWTASTVMYPNMQSHLSQIDCKVYIDFLQPRY